MLEKKLTRFLSERERQELTAQVKRAARPLSNYDNAKFYIEGLIKLQRDEQAQSTLEDLLLVVPTEMHAEILMYMGLICAIRSKYDEALKVYDTIKIDTPALRERRAFVLWKLRIMNKAIQVIESLEASHDETPEIMEIKAECELANKHAKRAEQCREKAAQLYSNRLRGGMSSKNGFNPEVMEDLNDLLRLNQGYLKMRKLRVEYIITHLDSNTEPSYLSRAVKDLQWILARPEEARHMVPTLQILIEKCKKYGHNTALYELQRDQLKLFPESKKLLLEYSITCFVLQKYQESSNTLLKVVNAPIQQCTFDELISVARGHLILGNEASALQCLESSRQTNPNGSQKLLFYSNLARHHRYCRPLDQYAVLKKTLQVDGNDIYTLLRQLDLQCRWRLDPRMKEWHRWSLEALTTINKLQTLWNKEEISAYRNDILNQRLELLFEYNVQDFKTEYKYSCAKDQQRWDTVTRIEYLYSHAMYEEALKECEAALQKQIKHRPNPKLLAKVGNIELIRRLCHNYLGEYSKALEGISRKNTQAAENFRKCYEFFNSCSDSTLIQNINLIQKSLSERHDTQWMSHFIRAWNTSWFGSGNQLGEQVNAKLNKINKSLLRDPRISTEVTLLSYSALSRENDQRHKHLLKQYREVREISYYEALFTLRFGSGRLQAQKYFPTEHESTQKRNSLIKAAFYCLLSRLTMAKQSLEEWKKIAKSETPTSLLIRAIYHALNKDTEKATECLKDVKSMLQYTEVTWLILPNSFRELILEVRDKINNVINGQPDFHYTDTLQNILLRLLSSQELTNYLTPPQFIRKIRHWQLQSLISKYLGSPSITVPPTEFHFPFDTIDIMRKFYTGKDPIHPLEPNRRV